MSGPDSVPTIRAGNAAGIATMPLRESRLKRYAVSQGFAGQWIGIAAGSMRSPRAYQAFALMGTEYGGQRTRISIDARVVLRRYREPQIVAFYKRQNSNDSAICVVGQRTRQPIDPRVVLRYRCTTRANPSKSCVVQRMRLGEPRFRGPANNRRAQPADKPFLSPPPPENASGSPHIEGSHLLV